jgi:type IV pilus assembly protein PilA
MPKFRKGFTLIELLIIIGIIGFLAAAILVAVDPVKRIKEARNTQRWEEVNSVLNAILVKQVDERKFYDGDPIAPIDGNEDTAQVIVRTTSGVICTTPALAPSCPGAVERDLIVPDTGPLDCVVLMHNADDNAQSLDPTFIAELPIDPVGSGADPEKDIVDSEIGDNNTGYYLNRTADNRIEIGACHPELGASIRVAR